MSIEFTDLGPVLAKLDAEHPAEPAPSPTPRRLKTYRAHNCNRRHRTHNALMKCAFLRAHWVMGDGPYALIAWCDAPTVRLCKTLQETEKAKATIDSVGCGHRCGPCRGHATIIARSGDRCRCSASAAPSTSARRPRDECDRIVAHRAARRLSPVDR
jgi:hypothetical protein